MKVPHSANQEASFQRDGINVVEDVLREENGLPPRYAVPHAVRTGPAFEGTWTQPDAATWLWQLRVAF